MMSIIAGLASCVGASRRAAMLSVALAMLGALDAFAQAPPARPSDRRGGWAIEAGVVASTPFVEDGNGVIVRSGVGASIGAGLSRTLADRLIATIGLRGSLAPLRIASRGHHWRAGTTTQVDVRAGVEVIHFRRVALTVSALGTRAMGPDDVIPFRTSGGAIWLWGGELGAAIPLVSERDLVLAISADVVRLAEQPDENPRLAGGAVGRLRLGVQRAFR